MTNPLSENLILILHLAAQGKLDKLDLQILVEKSLHAGIGSKSMGKKLRTPVSTIRTRVWKIKNLLMV